MRLLSCFYLIGYMAYCLIWIRHHEGVSHDQIPVAATSEYADLRNASSSCEATNIQLLCPNLLHDITNALGHITNITNNCSGTK